MTLWYLCCLLWLQLSLQLGLVYLCNDITITELQWPKLVKLHNFFTSNEHLHLSATHCGIYTIWGVSSNYHIGIVACTTLETIQNDFSVWCIGSCEGWHCRAIMTTSSELYSHRWHTLRWYCCVPGHSNVSCWAPHTLSTHINNSGGCKPSSCMDKLAWFNTGITSSLQACTTLHAQIYSYLVPDREHDRCPLTSMQLLSTNAMSDDNPRPAMSVDCGSPVLSKVYERGRKCV